MNTINPNEVIALLRTQKLRVRTGLWLMPSSLIGKESQQAARLGVDASDARQPILDAVEDDQSFLGLDYSGILTALDTICHSTLTTDCSLIYNLDLLLAHLTINNRIVLWEQLYSGFPHRPRALIIAIPDSAKALLPHINRLEAWRSEGRLAESSSQGGP